MVITDLSGSILRAYRGLTLCLIASVLLLVSSYGYAHGDEGKNYSQKEAYQASGEWDLETFEIKNPKIVFHYGDGFKFANNIVQVMREKLYPVIAIPGGPKDKVEVIVGTISVGTYDQRALHRGTIAGDASDVYDTRFGKPRKSQEDNLANSNIK